MDNAKFRRVFSDKYPLILIDEYQDSYKPIIERFVKYFIAEKKSPQFAFFGDAWQTICLLYTSDAADEEDSVDLGGRRIIKKKKSTEDNK